VGTGKLYRDRDEKFLANVTYQFHEESLHDWWGELVLTDYARLADGSGYILELEDRRRCKCTLKKRVNRAVASLPPRYIYHFSGTGIFR
jgi:hypothetical protein